ncbi:MAG: Fic family protein [Magnetococcales bacterium]|nr:Fic family protein [Magnetococcales bacterium]
MDDELNTDSLLLTNKILLMISELEEFKGAWRAIGRIAPERLMSLRRVATIESIGSSTRIEGACLSDREIEKLLSNIEILSFSSRDEQEVAGYAYVMDTVFENWKEIDLTQNHIMQLHRDLLKYSNKDMRHRGQYKTLSNHVEAFGIDGKSMGIVFQTATPFATPHLMDKLIKWTASNLEEKNMHPLLVIAIFVVTFLEIHPFQDGNGRLSRILTTLLLLRAGYSYVPFGSLESVIEKNKESYYLALRQTQGTIRSKHPDWQPWIIFFLKTLKQHKDRLEKKIEQEHLFIGKLPELSVKILELTREHGRVTIGEVARATNISRNTIKDHLSTLSKNGHLQRHGAGRGSWYSLG